jgi:hypothetical protein
MDANRSSEYGYSSQGNASALVLDEWRVDPVNWLRSLFNAPRAFIRTIEDEAWLMRAEEMTEENEKRLMELIFQVQCAVIEQTIDGQRDRRNEFR